MLTVNERIRAYRLSVGYSVPVLARIMGVDRSTAFRYEQVGTHIKRASLIAIAHALNVSPDMLESDAADDTLEVYLKADTASLKAMKVGPIKDLAPPEPYVEKIPILDEVRAGLPQEAEQQPLGVTYASLPRGPKYFALRVDGDSMDAAGIYNGSVVVVREQPSVSNGEIAIVGIGDDRATVKRFYRDGNTVTLIPQSNNKEYMPQVYNTKKTKVTIYGRVMQIQTNVP